VNAQPIRLLLVDNQADAREWLAEWLRRTNGFCVDTASDGHEAISRAGVTGSEYDVILMDLRLGDGPDGIKTMQEIRKEHAEVETIIITAFGGADEGVKAMKQGAYRYVLKPLNRDELVVYIRHAAERRKLKADLQVTEREHNWLRGLLSVSNALSSNLDLNSILDLIVGKLQELLGLDTCTVGLFDPDKTIMEFVAERGLGKKVTRRFEELPEDLVKRVFASSGMIEIPDVSKHPTLTKALERSDLKGFAILPLHGTDGEVLGLVTMGSSRSIDLIQNQKDLLEVLAGQAAVAIEKTRLYEQTQAHAKQLDVLDEVALEIAGPLEIDQLLAEIIHKATELLGGAGGGLFLRSDDGQHLELKAVYGLPQYLRGALVNLDEGVVGEVLKTRELVVRRDHWKWNGRLSALRQFKFSSVVGVPILSHQNDLLGVLAVHYAEPGLKLRQWKQEWLLRLGKHVGAAIEKTMEQEATQEIAHAVTSVLNHRELLRQIFEVLQTKLGYGPSSVGVLLKPEFANEMSEGADCIKDTTTGLVIKIGSDKGVTGHVAATGQLENVPDVSRDERYLPGLEGARSELAVPMVIRGKTIGVLNVESTEPGHFKERDERILTRIAAAIAIALDNARLFDEVKRNEERLGLVLKFSRQVQEAQSLDDSLRIVVDAMLKVCPAHFCHIMLLTRDGHNLRVRDGRAIDEASQWNRGVGQRCRLLRVRSLVDRLQNENHLILKRTERVGGGILAYVGRQLGIEAPLETALIVPLRLGKKILGLCVFWDLRPQEGGPFSQDNIEFATALAAQASAPLENARVLQLEQERSKVLERLNEVGNAIAATLEVGRVLDLIVKYGQELLNAEVCTVFRVRRRGFLTLEATHGSPPGTSNIGIELAIKKGDKTGLTGHIAAAGELVNLSGDDLLKHQASINPGVQTHLPSGNCSALLAIPLKSKAGEIEELIGLIKVENKKDGNGKVSPDQRFDNIDELILTSLAAQAVTAVRNAELFALANTLRKVATVVSSTLDLDEVLKRILSELKTFIPFDTASIQLVLGEELKIVACEGFDEEDTKRVLGLSFPKTDMKFPNCKVINERTPLLVRDMWNSPYDHFREDEESYRSGNIRSWLGVPLLHGDEVIGMLTLDSHVPDRYSLAQVDPCAAFAGQVVSAVANAKLHRSTQSMLDFVESLTKQIELQMVLQRIVEDAVNPDIIGADIAIIYPFNTEKEIFEQKAVHAGSVREPDKIHPPFEPESVVYRLLKLHEPLIRSNAAESQVLNRTFLTRECVKSVAAFTLRDDQQQIVGVMFINFRATHSFSQFEIDRMSRFASDAANAIQHARRFQALSEQLVAARNAALALSAMSAWAHDVAIDTLILRSDATSLGSYAPRLSRRASEILNRIKTTAEKIAKLIPDAPADLSRRQLVNLRRVFEKILNLHSEELIEKSINVTTNLDSLPEVEVNEWLLTEALNHLIQNAFRFIYPGGTLSVSGHANNKRVYVDISNTGPVIPPEKAEQLFRQRTASTDGGSGLGLMLTRLYLNACNGDVSFNSQGGLTTFSFYLPLIG
jgi:GAF domain-containing protein/ActR/RegA family two-component response regulator